MTDQTVRQSLSDRLNDLAQGWAVQWSDTDYTPTTGTPYLREDFLPAQTFQADMGSAGRNRHSGIYQLTLVTPAGEGPKEAEDKQTALMAAFKRGTRISYNGVVVVLDPPWIGGKQIEGDWIRRAINIPYYSFIDNP